MESRPYNFFFYVRNVNTLQHNAAAFQSTLLHFVWSPKFFVVKYCNCSCTYLMYNASHVNAHSSRCISLSFINCSNEDKHNEASVSTMPTPSMDVKSFGRAVLLPVSDGPRSSSSSSLSCFYWSDTCQNAWLRRCPDQCPWETTASVCRHSLLTESFQTVWLFVRNWLNPIDPNIFTDHKC